MKEIKLEKTFWYYEDYSSFDAKLLELFKAAKEASKTAYAPYSEFYVGASIMLKDGKVLKGNNQENAVYPLGLCAERVAILNAGAIYPNLSIDKIAITIDYERIKLEDLAFPCGSCRQVMIEYENRHSNDMEIYILGKNQKVMRIDSAKDLLPFAFTKDMLK